MTLEEAIQCYERDMCVGCKFNNTDISCLEEAHEIALKAMKLLYTIEGAEK